MGVKEAITQDNIVEVLNAVYSKSVNGIPKVSKPIDQFADDYLKMHSSAKIAAKAMLKNQVLKCTTSGFMTGFGGFITLPVTVPANVSSVMYVQMRMIACTAYMGGFDLQSDQVQTFVYACLAGVSVNQIVKKFGVEFGEKAAMAGIKRIPGKILMAINKKLGFRFITKFGEKGLINLGKMLPVVGAAINGGFDYAETKAVAARAYKMFIEHDFTVGEKGVIDVDELNEDHSDQI